ncbi:MAG: ATP-binding protein [Lachnospiraceae bacterium]|nr:ATP-binding protein [Lachnospiraceae bacterium]
MGCTAVYDVLMKILECLFYAAQGYGVQYLLRGFMAPKRGFLGLYCHRISIWLAGGVWIVTEMAADTLISRVNEKTHSTIDDIIRSGSLKIGKTLLCSAVLYIFCLCWYQGKWLLKLFLVVQFLSLRQLSIWAGYSLSFVGQRWTGQLERAFLDGKIQEAGFVLFTEVLGLITVAFVWFVQCALLLLFIRKIVGSYQCWEPERVDREAAFYLLPAVTGLLMDLLLRLIMMTVEDGKLILLYMRYPILYLVMPVIAIVLMLAIVFSFQSCQEMAAVQRERAERIVLENQIIQMQTSMAETERMYDGIRSVRHDIKNHLVVLRELMLQKYPVTGSGDENNAEIWRYFEDVCQTVGQLDNRIHTGNAISDAIVNAKFGYARQQMPAIQLDADAFALPESDWIKPYDIGVILNNGLDNAIEACMRLYRQKPDGRIYIAIRSFHAKNMFFMEIENSFDGVILLSESGSFPITTKEDKEVHGIGLKNIRNCAVKYGGDVDCIVDQDTFTLSVMVKDEMFRKDELRKGVIKQ